MSCSQDDLGKQCDNCTCKYKTVAVIPAFGRLPLLKVTIERLYKKNRVSKVIVIGHESSVESLCEQTGAVFVKHENHPLGKKWNAGFLKAKEYNPDAVLFVGSSDWVSDKWIDVMLPHLKTYDMVGKAGCYLLDIYNKKKFRLVFWPGYKKGGLKNDHHAIHRANESIGIGRLISREGLNKIDWKPFKDTQDSSLDWEMYTKLPNNKIIEDDSICSMAVSCNQWTNKHTFEHHWENRCPSIRIDDPNGFCKTWFDEYDKIF
jgi:hypothetical protein